MNQHCNYILQDFPIRKSRKQKKAFRKHISQIIQEEGYTVTEQKGGLSRSVNLIAGDVSRAKIIFTAHYDTCAALPLPNFIAPRNFFVFIIYQLILSVIILLLPFLAALAVYNWIDPKFATETFTITSIFALLYMIYGKANKSNVNDNTSGVITLLNAMLALPKEYRENVAFVFFDNEEAGLLGSSIFAAKYKKELKDTTIVNFDCVSDGNNILFFLSKKFKKDDTLMQALKNNTADDEINTKICSSSWSIYPSDQINFKKSCAVAAFHKSKLIGYWLGRIHTRRDNVLEERNIEFLSDLIIALSKIV